MSLMSRVYGVIPKPYSISSILNLTLSSDEIVEKYDNDPNLVARLKSQEGFIIIKRFGWRSKLHFYISPFIQSRAQMSWNTAKMLQSSGVNTPKPLFVYTQRKFGFIIGNFFITEAIHPHIKFRTYLKDGEDLHNVQNIIRLLAIYIARMHYRGILHRDLTTGNFLINKNDVYIVDLNRAKLKNKLSIHQRLLDLSKIYFNPTDLFSQNESIAYFFKHYAFESGIEIGWTNEYKKYRNRLVNRRNRIKLIKNFFRNK